MYAALAPSIHDTYGGGPNHTDLSLSISERCVHLAEAYRLLASVFAYITPTLRKRVHHINYINYNNT